MGFLLGVLSRYVRRDDLLEAKREAKRGGHGGGEGGGEGGSEGGSESESGGEEARLVAEWEREFAEETYESEISQMTPLVIQILEAYLKFR